MTSIAPWLLVHDGTEALAFYSAAFGAVAVEHHEDDAGVVQVAQLWIGGADFWIQTEPGATPDRIEGGAVRMILAVDDPDAVFARAVAAGAVVVNGDLRRPRLAHRAHHRSVRPRLGDRPPPRRLSEAAANLDGAVTQDATRTNRAASSAGHALTTRSACTPHSAARSVP